MVLSLGGKWLEKELKMTLQAELCLCPDISSSVDSQIKVFVEDIPVKALMPNLVQPYQKTLLLWNVQEQTPSCFWRDFSDAILFFGRRTSVVEDFQQLSRQWIRLRLCSHLPEIPVWKSWNDVSNRVCLCPDISTVESRILQIVFNKHFDRENHVCMYG